MTIEFLHVCDYAFQCERGKPCIVGITEAVIAQGFPAECSVVTVAIEHRGAPLERGWLTCQVLQPNAEVLGALDYDIQLDAAGRRFMAHTILRATFPQAGTYTFRVTAGEQTLAEKSIRVRLPIEETGALN